MRINKYIKKTILTSDKKIVRNFNYKSKKLSNKHLTFLENKKVFQEIKKRKDRKFPWSCDRLKTSEKK